MPNTIVPKIIKYLGINVTKNFARSVHQKLQSTDEGNFERLK